MKTINKQKSEWEKMYDDNWKRLADLGKNIWFYEIKEFIRFLFKSQRQLTLDEVIEKVKNELSGYYNDKRTSKERQLLFRFNKNIIKLLEGMRNEI